MNIVAKNKIRITIITSILLYLQCLCCKAQVQGCTDILATNYNAAATINNGSCVYSVTTYTPPIQVNSISSTLDETSGLQIVNKDLWTFNDSGGDPAIYKIDSLTNTILQKVTLGGATNVDWEDIAFDGTYIYIGDFGNNDNGARTNLKIYKVPVAAIPPHTTNATYTVAANLIQVINFTYADQPQPPVAQSNTNTIKYDCEAMLIDSGKIHLFTKDRANLSTTHYIINTTNAGTYALTPVETLATNYLVTAADKAPNQQVIILYGYQKTGAGLHFIHLLSNYYNGLYFNGNKRKLDLPDATIMGQGEGITFRDDSTGYISNELVTSGITIPQRLRFFNVGRFVSSWVKRYTFIGNGNWSIDANWKNNLKPPTTLPYQAEIIIDPLAIGNCNLDILYTIPTGCKITVVNNKKFIVQGNLSIQ
jgi:hypothetical protein